MINRSNAMTTQQTIGRWILATFTIGIDVDGYRKDHHCYIRRNGSQVEVIAKGGLMATLSLADARQHFRVCRYRDGSAIAVANQTHQNVRWAQRHGQPDRLAA